MALRRTIGYKARMGNPVKALAADLRRHCARLPRLLGRTTRRTRARDVHELRVLTRRIRVAVRLANMHDAHGPARRAAKELRKLGRALGTRRMWDVAIDDLEALGMPSDKLGPARDESTRALRGALKRIHADRLCTDLKALSGQLGKIAPADLAAATRRMRAPLARARARPPRQRESRHALRIRVKKVRYLLEACGHPAAAARRLQSALGREHDLVVLQQLAGRSSTLRAREKAARARTDRLMLPCLRTTLAALDRLERAMAATAR